MWRVGEAEIRLSSRACLRAEGWICLTATGLNLIGRVGHRLFSDSAVKQSWEEKAGALANLDWSRGAAIWQTNIVQNGKKALTQQGPMK